MEKAMKAYPGVLAVCGIFLFCGSLPAQQATSTGGFIVSMGSVGPPAIIGEPYSATTETENSQTLADGTHIEQHSQITKSYRDSQGRTRTESYLPDLLGNSDPNTPAGVFIHDPVAGVTFTLNPRDHTARQMGVPRPRDNAVPAPSVRQRPPETPESLRPREDLGTQMMNGLLVEGTRITTTIPTGAQGNDRPIQIVTEHWLSKELGIDVLTKTSDPRNGEHETRITSIDRNEPDPTLFQLPPDYTLVQQQ
jgi:hypothetical protein